MPTKMDSTPLPHTLDDHQVDPQQSSRQEQTGDSSGQQTGDSEPSAVDQDGTSDQGRNGPETHDSENGANESDQNSEPNTRARAARSDSRSSKSSMEGTRVNESNKPESKRQEWHDTQDTGQQWHQTEDTGQQWHQTEDTGQQWHQTEDTGQQWHQTEDTGQQWHQAEAGGDAVKHAGSPGSRSQNHDVTTGWSSSEAADREPWSPTRPRPPTEPFHKPSPQRMAELDRHVLATPRQLVHFPVFELAQYLIRPTRTEVEKAYVIFRWVTCQHVRPGEVTPRGEGQAGEEEEEEEEVEEKEKGKKDGDMDENVTTLGSYVTQLQTGRRDYADLFSLVCKCVNMETHKIEGKFRYYCPQPSPQVCRTRPATWSALLLPGGWGLVDCALGARYWASEAVHRTGLHRGRQRPQPEDVAQGEVQAAAPDSSDSAASATNGADSGVSRSGERSDSAVWRVHHEHSPQNFYFLPHPQWLVTSHWPHSSSWQLLPHPLAEADFLTSLLYKPHLHHLGVELLSPTSLRVTEICEEMDITWRLKVDGLRRFAFRLFSLADTAGSSHRELRSQGFLENQCSKKAASLRLIPPTSGRYVCEVYGTYLPARGNEMTHMCSFDLDFIKTTSTVLKFPHNDRVEWGPGAECVALGLTPKSHVTGCVNVEKGETELVFSFSRPLLVTQKLFSASDEGQGTEVPRSTINFRDCKNRIKILLRIPDPGDYVLSIYVKEESHPGKCQLVCNYLVLCDSGLPEVVHPFPALPFNKLGPTKAFFELNMKLVCPKRSCIVVAPYSGKVTFVFGCPEETELSFDLLHQGQDGEEVTDTGDYAQHTYQSGESVFRARLPVPGDYLFYLYGKPLQGEGHKFLLYSALVECAVPNKDCLPLPRVVPEFRSRVQILSPLRRSLVLEAVSHFAVRTFGIKAVAVLGQSGLQNFLNEDDEDEEGRDDDDDGEEGVGEPTETKDSDEEGIPQPAENDEKDKQLKDEESVNITQTSPQTQAQNGETEEWKGKEVTKGNHEAVPAATQHSHGTPPPPRERTTSATKSVTLKLEDDADDDEEEREDEWQVWRCKVKVSREDEGSGVKLCVQPVSARDSHMICVAEFEVITERTMAAKLDHQHSVWTAAEVGFKVRPDSGHRSDIDDEERQSAYFLDDEVYLSNPLGDDNSDTDDTDDSDDEFRKEEENPDSGDDVSADDEPADSELEDTATSGSGTATQQSGRTVEMIQAKGSTSPRRHLGGDGGAPRQKPERGGPAAKKASAQPRKAKSERGAGEVRRTFHASAVYNAPQPTAGSRDARHKAAMKVKDSTGHSSDARRKEKKQQTEQGQRRKEAGLEKPAPSAGEKDSSDDVPSTKIQKKNVGDSTVHQNSYTRERTLRRKLWKACERREREAIKKAVWQYTKGGYSPCPDLAAGERLLRLFELQDALKDAVTSENTDAIRQALTEVERHGFAGEMSVVCRKAHAMLSPHRQRNRAGGGRLLDLRVETDMRTLMEIRSYRCPPHVVHHVIVATLLLLGVHEGLTKTWKRCRRRLQVLGPEGILKKMLKVRVDALHPEIAARAQLLLDKHTTEEAGNAGPGVLAVYEWASKVLARVASLADLDEAYTGNSGNAPPQPATKRRQKEIFSQQLAQSTTTTTTTTTTAAAAAAKVPDNTSGNEVQKTKGVKQVGPDTPRNKSSNNSNNSKRTQGSCMEVKCHSKKGEATDVEKNPRRSENTAARKEPVTQRNRHVTMTGTGRQNTQTASKRTPGHERSVRPAPSIPGKSTASQHASNTNSNTAVRSNTNSNTAVRSNTNSNTAVRSKSTRDDIATRTKQNQPLYNEQKSQTPGYRPRPRPSLQNSRKDGSENNNAPNVVSQPIRAQHSSSASQGTSTAARSSPERSAKASTATSKAEEGRASQQTPRPSAVRCYQPHEQLRCLSPQKSPLFRPANRNKTVRSRASLTPRRPKTTPAPVLQSTFFFASLVDKDKGDDEEVNNNIPLTFKNYYYPMGSGKAARSAGTEGRTGALMETRLGQRGQPRYTSSARHSATDITTPDI